LGWSPKDNREKIDIEEVIQLFDLGKINRRNAAFDLDKCLWLNGQYVTQMSLERFRELSAPFLAQAKIEVNDEQYLLRVLEIVKERIKLFRDVPDRISYFFTEEYTYDEASVEKTLRAPQALQRLATLRTSYLELKDWSVAQLENALKNTASQLGCGTGGLVHPARVAVSGRSVGPSLYHMLEVMGRERVLNRFQRTLDRFGPVLEGSRNP
ncbi:MAG: glutamate--tRNA ligase, partial [Verrucomicrobia bacterium]|nr:glutamate--tRNA ligase [Verrucomicrobiota bacterium]